MSAMEEWLFEKPKTHVFFEIHYLNLATRYNKKLEQTLKLLKAI